MPFTLRSLALAATLAVSAGTVSAQEVTLRFQHFVSPKSANPTHFMDPWAKAIEEQSGGRIKVEIYAGMALGGKATSQYDLIRDGVIDGGWVIPGYQPGRFPEAEALELPFITPKNTEAASIAAWNFTQKYLLDDFADVHVIMAHLHGEGIIHKKGPNPESLEDFAGLRLRGPSRPATMLLKELGATPVGMPVPAFPEALSKGVIDGGVVPWEIVPSLKLHELADSHTDVAGDYSLYNLYFIWAMNKAKYESLPDDLKKVIDDNSGLMAAAWAGRAHDTGDAEGKAVVAATVNPITEISPEETDRIKDVGEKVIAAWIEEANSKGLDGAALVEDARTMMAEGIAAQAASN
ncbi:TRAP-type C4-dicarboxylate transport system substrate-binding protein [Aliiruegeria haliotis]|uniref:TRAP-type C4-dicarboxylate transport system substrate-binding protein n=1 Tax=Aliiruegeria haliotis TaxID=1280846 RepID=A0A2T0RTH8_9RHOB|nr:TRAP transporter substrate-binding protein [Aliiruegeria haliotis]PRY24509.1 TRAP-type C4-dicarboxylate transport system substrate-binding protein [Aliiruegeria haliotis]